MSVEGLPPGSYLAPSGEGCAELRQRGSRFLAVVMPVTDEEEARRRLDELRDRHSDATHHCWARSLGRERLPRCSDAGEPSGTAGRPIQRVIEGAGLSDILIVVVRWFGGVKLGKGGLARAYAAAAREALVRVSTEVRMPFDELAVSAPYAAIGAIKRLLRPPEIELVSEDYGAEARVVLRVADHRRAELEAALADLRIDAKGS